MPSRRTHRRVSRSSSYASAYRRAYSAPRSRTSSLIRRPLRRQKASSTTSRSARKLLKSIRKTNFKLEIESYVAREISALFYLAFAILNWFSFSGKAGVFGQWWYSALLKIFGGIGSFFVPILFFIVGLVMFFTNKIKFNFTRVFGLIIFTASILGLVHLSSDFNNALVQVEEFGGWVGFVSSIFLRIFFSDTGARLILMTTFLVSLLLIFGIGFRDIFAIFRIKKEEEENEIEEKNLNKTFTKKQQIKENLENDLNINLPEKIVKIDKANKKRGITAEEENQAVEFKKDSLKEKPHELNIVRPESLKKIQKNNLAEATTIEKEKSNIDYSMWRPPSLDLLDPASSEITSDEAVLKKKAENIREKLAQFGIEVTMQDVNIGPTVMQYTLKPAAGIKLASITNLKNDLALSLAAKSLRIEAPIPGKSLVGIEIPNDQRTNVRLRELLECEDFSKITSSLKLIMGRAVSGKPIIADLAKMPHLLVAGATGAGKSVAINSFLTSLLYQNSPAQLKLILVDPKRVELMPYNGIPHLLTPVITEPDKTISALRWAVAEMTRRYHVLQDARVRNINEYNQLSPPQIMPFIVIVIDELADLMSIAKKEVEGTIQRLAQMARAVGMHLIVATQRPSVNVITGVIKANIPTRLSFAVTSFVDSKTILDQGGAEDLLGSGDMLFLAQDMSKPLRIQGVYISTDEINRVTNTIKLEMEPDYDNTITKTKTVGSTTSSGGYSNDEDLTASEGDSDETIVQKALRVITENKKASASLLQRRLSLGYARAARVLDLLEERGYIGPVQGSKPREIFVNQADVETATVIEDCVVEENCTANEVKEGVNATNEIA